MGSPRSDWARDGAVATTLALLFTLAWTIRDWANLSHLRLPDTDDVVRLQQVRDWLAGQAFGDLSQHRLGAEPGGALAMHWSRLPDLVPGGLIAALTPLIGRPAAEVAAVALWPGLLFAAALTLTARIARAQQVSPPTAQLIAALAFPATAMFLPGRIDHHGLQLVLLLGIVAALLAKAGTGSGIGVALGSVASLVVGMETAPFVALAVGLAVIDWVNGRAGTARQLAAVGATLIGGLGLAAAVFAPWRWAYPACDGFTRSAWQAALLGGVGVLVLAAAGRWVTGRGARLALAAAVGVVAAAAVRVVAPSCFHPYGGVDPVLAARWLTQVGEAQPLFAAPLSVATGQCGLLLAGIAAGAWLWWRTRSRGWAILLLFQGGALAIALWQLRGATAGALLAAPALAGLVAAARSRGSAAVAAAWLVAAGILYPLIGTALGAVQPAAGDGVAPTCTGPAALAALNRLPPGLVAGPIDLGAWGLAATRHRFLAAPYHRNNRGNLIALRVVDGPAARARAEGRAAQVDYLAICGPAPAWIVRERPGWLHRVSGGDGLTIYRIDRLPQAIVPT